MSLQAGKHETSKKHRTSLVRSLGLALGIVVLMALVACLLWLCASKGEEPTSEPNPHPEKAITEAAPAQNVATNALDALIEPEPPKRFENGVEVVSSTVTTNSSGAIIEQLVLADGKRKKKVYPPKPVFENPSDQVIAMAVSVKPGESMPPLPDIRNLDEDFAKSLLTPIVINENDSDEIKELKAKVMETRAYLAEDIKRGGSVVDALLEHQKEVERIADNRLMAIQELQKLQSEGDDEMARAFALKINESFRAQGIPEIPVPNEEQEEQVEQDENAEQDEQDERSEEE